MQEYLTDLQADHPAIQYFERPVDGPVSRLSAQLESGTIELDYRDDELCCSHRHHANLRAGFRRARVLATFRAAKSATHPLNLTVPRIMLDIPAKGIAAYEWQDVLPCHDRLGREDDTSQGR